MAKRVTHLKCIIAISWRKPIHCRRLNRRSHASGGDGARARTRTVVKDIVGTPTAATAVVGGGGEQAPGGRAGYWGGHLG
jgi:hypothetical protein